MKQFLESKCRFEKSSRILNCRKITAEGIDRSQVGERARFHWFLIVPLHQILGGRASQKGLAVRMFIISEWACFVSTVFCLPCYGGWVRICLEGPKSFGARREDCAVESRLLLLCLWYDSFLKKRGVEIPQHSTWEFSDNFGLHRTRATLIDDERWITVGLSYNSWMLAPRAH